jgi:ribosomal protein S18 acetylase RimI-like enzyme
VSLFIPRPLDPSHDLADVAALIASARAGGGTWHPGGIQWWLRELGREALEAHVIDGAGGLNGFVLLDGEYVIAVTADPARWLEVVAWAEGRLAEIGLDAIETTVVDRDPFHVQLLRRGYLPKTTEGELMLDLDAEPAAAPLPTGFTFASLVAVTDDAYIELHRASWSDKRPSPYRPELHAAVRRMPGFLPELVTIALAPDGTPAASCIGWLDDRSKTLEIEPLGTHPEYRRLGLARAVVREVAHRAWLAGAGHVLVWNDRATNPAAYGLYTSAGMTPRRQILTMRRALNSD